MYQYLNYMISAPVITIWCSMLTAPFCYLYQWHPLFKIKNCSKTVTWCPHAPLFNKGWQYIWLYQHMVMKIFTVYVHCGMHQINSPIVFHPALECSSTAWGLTNWLYKSEVDKVIISEPQVILFLVTWICTHCIPTICSTMLSSVQFPSYVWTTSASGWWMHMLFKSSTIL